MTAERNDYPGAAVFYTVRYHVRADGSGHPTRYTPSWDRACALLTRFLVDVTDPAGLRPASPPAPTSDG